MGKFFTSAYIINHRDFTRMAVVLNLLVDTGSEATWVRRKTLESVGIVPVKRVTFEMADGSRIVRDVGFAIVQVGSRATTDEVVFADANDLELFGVRAMEGLRLVLDPRQARLLYSGPAMAAQNFPSPKKRRGGPKVGGIRTISAREAEDFRQAEVIECTPMLDARNLRKRPDGVIGLHTSGKAPTKAELNALQVVKLHRSPRKRTGVEKSPQKL